MEKLEGEIGENTTELGRLIHILQKLKIKLVQKPSEIISSRGNVRSDWTQEGIGRMVGNWHHTIFNDFYEGPQPNTSHSLQKRINSRHAARMGVPTLEEQAKDGGLYF
ncbi:uncharacterized protein JCM6883_000290 [Sporobolomyces salmoneus]|uniref:uncharacterized protein n=1 Tax=Sporobolomyces salmoneus TaxID=183962 RepID=UPI003181D498